MCGLKKKIKWNGLREKAGTLEMRSGHTVKYPTALWTNACTKCRHWAFTVGHSVENCIPVCTCAIPSSLFKQPENPCSMCTTWTFRGLQKHNEFVTISKAIIFVITKHGQKRKKILKYTLFLLNPIKYSHKKKRTHTYMPALPWFR